jgi:hypothetical protein
MTNKNSQEESHRETLKGYSRAPFSLESSQVWLFVGIVVIAAFIAYNVTMQSESRQPAEGDSSGAPLVRMDLDLKQVVLGPNDVTDLFPATTYSIEQPISREGLRGLTVTYPTRIIEHSSAFAEGFATRIEIFSDVSKATQAFESAITQQHGNTLEEIEKVGETTRAFAGKALTPEGFETGSFEHVALFRQRNVVVTITLRTPVEVRGTRLGELAKVIQSRLSQ